MITDATTSHLSFNSIVNTSLNYLTVCSRWLIRDGAVIQMTGYILDYKN
jgi:hypothetical protein